MFFHAIFIFTVTAILFHLWRDRSKGWSADRVVRVSLLYLLSIQWGFGAAWLAISHIVIPDTIAGFIGWPPGNPFQLEFGFASLGIACLGVLSLWFRGKFWIAPVVAQSTFLLGAAYVHIQDILISGNLAPGNAGAILFYDIAIPVLACSLLYIHYRQGGMDDA